jgi:hypothetical protein
MLVDVDHQSISGIILTGIKSTHIYHISVFTQSECLSKSTILCPTVSAMGAGWVRIILRPGERRCTKTYEVSHQRQIHGGRHPVLEVLCCPLTCSVGSLSHQSFGAGPYRRCPTYIDMDQARPFRLLRSFLQPTVSRPAEVIDISQRPRQCRSGTPINTTALEPFSASPSRPASLVLALYLVWSCSRSSHSTDVQNTLDT